MQTNDKLREALARRKGRGRDVNWLKRIINRLLRRKCGSCLHWRYTCFRMGYCGKGPFVPIANSIDSKLACEDWSRKGGAE